MVHTFPLGAVYLIEQGRPFEEMGRDLDRMVECGFDSITIWPVANAWLAKGPDEFVFRDTLRLLDMAQSRNLRVIVQLIGQNQSQEYMPDCLLRPEMMIQPAENRPHTCFWANLNHPEVDAAVKRYLREAVEALKAHPAIMAWDVFNESHLRTDDAWTTALYRQWLAGRYGTIDELNRRWYRRFAAFDQINPEDRAVAYSVWSSLLPVVEYERFRSENLTSICARFIGYVKELDSTRPVFVDGTAGQFFAGDGLGGRNCDEFDTARISDVYGGTYYPKSWGRNLGGKPWELGLFYSLSADAAARAGKDFWITELQTHTQSALTPGSEVEPHELVNWIWAGIAGGAKLVHLWRWRPFLHGYQSTGRGLTQLDGTPGPRAKAIGSLIKNLRQHEQTIAEARPVDPAVRLVISYRSRLFMDAFLRGVQRFPAALAGWYRAFWSSGIPVGISELSMLDEKDLAAPVLVLPSLISFSEADAQKLAGYVENGGTLIADARLGVCDQWGDVRAEGLPGRTLSPVFGVREIDVAGPIDFHVDAQSLRGSFLSQILEVAEGTEVLAATADGRPAVVANRFGRGRTIYFAAFMGETFAHGMTDEVRRSLREHILHAAPQTPWAEKKDAVHVRFHRRGSQLLAYLINFGERDEAVVLHNCPPARMVLDLVTNEEIPGGTVDVPAESTRIVLWENA